MGINLENKKCSRCGEVKQLTEFYWRKDQNKYRSECKTCFLKIINTPQRKLYNQQYKKDNKEAVNRRNTIYRKKNPSKVRKWRVQYYNRYSDELKEKSLRWQNKDAHNKINHRIYSGITKSITRNRNGYFWEVLLGYTFDDLVIHLQSKFQNGMNWSNYGRNGWVIDHIIPVSLWVYSSYDDREFKLCWSLANIQPLWEKDNQRKVNYCE